MGIYGHKFDNFRSDLHPEVVQIQEDSILYEFDFNQTIEKIKSAIKRAILNLVDKIDNWLDKHPDSKVAQALKSILIKLRNLLTKADKIKSKEDVEEVKSEVNKNKEEAEDLMNRDSDISDEFKKAVKNKKLLTIRIMIKDSLLIDKSFKLTEKLISYCKKEDIDPFIEDNPDENEKPKSEWDEDYMNSKLVEFVNSFTKERLTHLKRIILYIYNENATKSKLSKFAPKKFEPETFGF